MLKKAVAWALLLVLSLNALPMNALAFEMKYEPVEIQLKASGSLETQFRNWAADVIDEYYNRYCAHGQSGSSVYYDFDFTYLHKVRDLVWRWGYTPYDSQVSEVGQFDGIYREYYLAALAKIDYDLNGSKSTYTIVRKDNETAQQYEERMLPFYKLLLIESMEERYVIDDDAYSAIDPREPGVYRLVRGSDDRLHMEKDPSKTMQNLEDMAVAECLEAWSDFGISTIDLMMDAADVYAELNGAAVTGSGEKFLKSVKDSAISGLMAVFKTGVDSIWKNQIKRLENNMNEAMKCYIGNKELVGYNRIIHYLENVYTDDSFITYRNDSVFQKAVEELIELAGEQYTDNIAAIQDWYAETAPLKNVLSNDEILWLICDEFVEQLFNMAVSVFQTIRKNVKDYSTTENEIATSMMNALDCVLVVAKSYVKYEVENRIKAYKKTGSYDFEEDMDEALRKAAQDALNEVVKIITEMKNADTSYLTYSDYRDQFVLEILSAVIKHTNELRDLAEDINWQAMKDQQLKIITEDQWSKLWNIVCSIVGSAISSAAENGVLTKLYYNKAVRSVSTNSMESFKKHAEVVKIIKTVGKLWSSMMNTAEELANAVYATIEDWTDEKQTSYKAVGLTSSYKASSPLEQVLNVQLTEVKTLNGDLRGAILNPQAYVIDNGNRKTITCRDILQWTDEIMLQVEFDIIGTRWLCDLFGSAEAASDNLFFGNSEFYSYIMRQISKSSAWEQRMTAKIARDEYNLMADYRSSWLKGWNEDFRTLQ